MFRSDNAVPEVAAGEADTAAANRKGRFAWYYMTTTVTSVSTSTATSTTYSSKLTTNRVYIHCRHTILAHLFFRDFSFFPYCHTLLVFLSLSHSPLSLSLSL